MAYRDWAKSYITVLCEAIDYFKQLQIYSSSYLFHPLLVAMIYRTIYYVKYW